MSSPGRTHSILPSLALAAALVSGPAASAAVRSEKVQYQHGSTQLEGYLAWDDAIEGRRPGVLVVHEWWGLNDYARKRADMLARLGYVAFALDMYGEARTTKHPAQAREWSSEIRENVETWRERASRGLEVLRKQERVDPDRVAAIGYCFGGATVLQLAYAGAPLRGVASFHGSLPLPEGDAAEEIGPRLLICHGAADPFVPEERVNALRDALEKADADWQMVLYGGARHSFTNPDAGEAGVEGLAYSPRADESSWAHLRVFLSEIFEEEPRERRARDEE